MGKWDHGVARSIGRRIRRVLAQATRNASAGVPLHIEPMEPRVHLSVAGPVGPEIIVDDVNSGPSASAGADATGVFVVAWSVFSAATGSKEILARRYDVSGNAIGEAFQVNTYTPGSQNYPDVAMSDDGQFAIVWQSDLQDGDHNGVYGQLYDAAGNAIGQEFRVNASTQGDQTYPQVAMDDSGGFVVVYQSRTGTDVTLLRGQRFDALGTPQGQDFPINTDLTGSVSSASVAMDATGGFVVGWMFTYKRVAVRRFDATANPKGGELTVASTATSGLGNSVVAMNDAGRFVVTWTEWQTGGDICAMAYDAQGDPAGAVFRVNSTTAGEQSGSRVAMDDEGHAIITWGTYVQDGTGSGIYGQRCDATGALLGGEFCVASQAGSSFGTTDVAADAQGGGFVVAWRCIGTHAQRYAVSDEAGASIVGRVWDDANINGVQDAGEASRDGVTVNLFNADGAFAGTTVTANGGLYRLDGILPRVGVFVQVAPPAGFTFAPANLGTDPNIDSDPDPASGRTGAMVPAAGQVIEHVDAGLVRLPTFTGTVYFDSDGSGTRGGDEIGLPGWVVFADINDNGQMDPGEPSDISGIDGSYCVWMPLPETYTIRLVPQDLWTVANAKTIAVGLGQVVADVDFGNRTAVPIRSAGAASPQRLVNSTTKYNNSPIVAMRPNGDYLVLWSGSSGTNGGVFLQKCSADGMAVGGEVFVGAGSDSNSGIAAAFDAAGNFVITWARSSSGSNPGIHAQRYNADGAPIGQQFKVSTSALDTKGNCNPSIAMDSAGNFTISWRYVDTYDTGWDLVARCYDAQGTPLGNPFIIASKSVGDEQYAAMAYDPAGNLLVAFGAYYFSDARHRIEAARFDTTGNPLGEGFLVSASWAGQASYPMLAMDSDGNYVITWATYGQDGSGYAVHARRYNSADVPQGAEFRVNTYTVGNQRSPRLAMSPDGKFVIVWQSADQDGSKEGIYGQQFNAAGVPEGGEFQINTTTLNAQTLPGVGMDAAGNFAVAWLSTERDGSTQNIYAQQYKIGVTSGWIAGRVWNDANGNGLQDVGETGRDGVTVKLLNSAGAVVATTLTANGGLYTFNGVLSGQEYRAEFTAATGTVFTWPDAGSDDAIDSDADPFSGRSGPQTVTADQTLAHVDAGLASPASVTGAVFYDVNGNGTRDAGDTGVAGFVVFADANGNGLFDAGEISSKTDATGKYSLSGLPFGLVTIAQLPQHMWQMAGPRSVTLTPGQNLTGINLPNIALARNLVAGPIGPLLTASVDTTYAKSDVASAADSSGNFVLVWTSNGDIYARRFSAAGVPQGDEFLVNQTTAGAQSLPAVAMDSQGNFAVAWQGMDESNAGIFAQRFNAAGEEQGDEFRVNSYTAGSQSRPALAMDAAGNFVITWDSNAQGGPAYGVFAQRYNAAGVAQGAEFRVSAANGSNQTDPAVAMDANGRFVIAWPDSRTGTVNIFAQRYDASSQLVGGAFQVNTSTASRTQKPVVAMNADGEFTIAWQTTTYGVFVQRYDAAGTALGAETPIDTKGLSPSIAMDPDGGFTILWSNSGFRAQRYNASGLRNGQAILLSSSYQYAAVTTDARGCFVISAVAGKAVQAQRYGVTDNPASISGRVWEDINGNGVQEAGENGLNAVVVELVAGDCVLGSTVTANGGVYRIGDLIPGEPYALRLNTTLLISPMDAGADDATDSDFDPNTKLTEPLVLNLGENAVGVDAGLAYTATISGVAFHDANGDGLRNAGEAGLLGWTVYDDADEDGMLDNAEPSTVSAADGAYSLSGLRLGRHQIRVVMQYQWSGAPPVPVTVLSGEKRNGVDVGASTAVVNTFAFPLGGEFRVDTITAGNQQTPSVAIDAQGNSVVVWDNWDFGVDGPNIYGQLYMPDGTPRGGPFLVNVNNYDYEGMRPSVAMNADGAFVVVWQAYDVSSEQRDIFARQFNAQGVPTSGELRVSSTNLWDVMPRVAIDGQGGFAVAWQKQLTSGNPANYDTYARRYDATGTAMGAEFRVGGHSPYYVADQKPPAVAMDPRGDFVIAWYEAIELVSSTIYVQRYKADGTAVGDKIMVNPVSMTSVKPAPAISMSADGAFVVAWSGGVFGSIDQYLYAQRYDPSGVPQGSPMMVNTYRAPFNPVAAADWKGNFVIAWQTIHQDGDRNGVYARRYSAAGIPLGDEFRVNTHTTYDQDRASVSVGAEGDFLVAWKSLHMATNYHIFAQRYQLDAHPYAVIAGSPEADSFSLGLSGSNLQISSTNGTLPSSMRLLPLASLKSLAVAGSSGLDRLSIDLTLGNPIPVEGLFIEGGRLEITTQRATEPTSFPLIVRNGADVDLNRIGDLASLSISDGARAELAGDGAKSLQTAKLAIAADAMLDLADGNLVVRTTAATRDAVLAQIFNWIRSARGPDGSWLGAGLTSSAAKADPTHRTGLAIAINDRGGDLGPLFARFAGADVDTNCIMVKYTWNGDANLDGVVNADDYFRIDSGFLTQVGGYQNGDFNYDGVVNADDYFLIDSAFLGQTGPLGTKPRPVETPVAEAAEESADDTLVLRASQPNAGVFAAREGNWLRDLLGSEESICGAAE